MHVNEVTARLKATRSVSRAGSHIQGAIDRAAAAIWSGEVIEIGRCF